MTTTTPTIGEGAGREVAPSTGRTAADRLRFPRRRPATAATVEPPATSGGPLQAVSRPDVFAAPARRLPVRTAPLRRATDQPDWWFLAAHGGSGASLLASLSRAYPDGPGTPAAGPSPEPRAWPHARACGRAWPDPSLDRCRTVVVVATASMSGLAWARDIAGQYLAEAAPADLRLLGLVVIADGPGRPPKPVTAAVGLLGGVYARIWRAPYVPAYRLLTRLPDEPAPPLHPGVADVLSEIRTAVTR